MNFKVGFSLFVFALFLVSVFAQQDPKLKLKQCEVRCKSEKQWDEKKLRSCLSVCERGCLRDCESEQGEQREGCQRQCQGRHEDNDRESEKETQEEHNPYVFEDQHFSTGIQTQHGQLKILQTFSERSKLLRGIENYRVVIFETDPQTFVLPYHLDAEAVIFVAKGKGSVSIIRQDKRESFSIQEGDLLRINAGATAYLVNRDNREKLILVKLLQPVSTRPGHFEAFFGAGGENPESFFKVFSEEILEAAFNTRKDKLQRLFGQQKQGVIVKASQEQIKALSRHEESGTWPFGGESKGTFNIYQQRPTHSNQYGQFYEVDSNHFRQLRDLDISVSIANISRGAMTSLFYNSKATKISVVVEGEGYLEMACPHLSRSRGSKQEQRFGGGYQKISADLKPGTVVVIPAGHPSVTVASNNQNLQVICFEVNAYNNEKYALAGKRNVINQLEREALELAFGVPAREIEEVFGKQEEEFFFKGPRQQHQGRDFQ